MLKKRLFNVKFETEFVFCSNEIDCRTDSIIVNECDSVVYESIKKALIEIIEQGTSYRSIKIKPFEHLPFQWEKDFIPYSNNENEKSIEEILMNN